VKNLAISRRYAKALLLIGKEDGKAETYRKELDAIEGVITGNSGLEQTIANPLHDAASRKKVLAAIIKNMNLSAADESLVAETRLARATPLNSSARFL